MTKLKRCPFCGGEAELERVGTGRVSMIYKCTDCSCTLETSETFISDDCHWNNRADYPSKLIELLTKVSALSNLDMNDFYYLIDDIVDDATDLLNEIKAAS